MELKALTIDQHTEVVKFIQKYHKFAGYVSDEKYAEILKTYPNMKRYGLNIKYIDSIYDTHDGSVWMIKFRGLGGNYEFSSNHFAGRTFPKTWKYDNLFDLIMDFLKGDFKPKEEFMFDPNKNN